MALFEAAAVTKLATITAPMAVEIAGALIAAPRSPSLPKADLFGWTGQDYAFDPL